jgi:epoxyqueuosine reductase
MDYMAAHGLKRARPAELVPGTVSVITARMDYLPRATPDGWQAVEWQGLADPQLGHRVALRPGPRLPQGAARAAAEAGRPHRGRGRPLRPPRAFTDSAPVLEVELAARSGLGWRGKHTLVLIHRDGGSMFFLGELFVDLALPPDRRGSAHCGTVQRLHRRLPDAAPSSRPTGWTRGAASPT